MKRTGKRRGEMKWGEQKTKGRGGRGEEKRRKWEQKREGERIR